MALASARPLAGPAIPKTLAASRFNPRLAVGLLVLAAALLGLVAMYRGAQPRTVEVLRAAHDVPPGEVLRPDDLQVVAEALPEDVAAGLVAAGERQSLVGRRLAQPLFAGRPDQRTPDRARSTRQLGATERAVRAAGPDRHGHGAAPAAERPRRDRGHHQQDATRDGRNARRARVRTGLFDRRRGVEQRIRRPRAVPSATDLSTSRTTTLVLRTDAAGYQALARARQVGELDLSLVGAEDALP